MTDQSPLISVILPCLNEEKTIELCIKKIKKAFDDQQITFEIIVCDNGSTDRSASIAKELGAIVVHEPKRGYGSAYITGLNQAQGQFLLMGDADDTYDFLEIPKFIDALSQGYDFVIGNRFKGNIHQRAMPWMNRYIGNPILSGLCRIFFHTTIADFHCGLRGMTREAYTKLNLKCLGMEFATEMIVEALQKNLRIKEIPIDYHPRLGQSKLSPALDAWRHMRFMLLFCPTWLYLIPGSMALLIGTALMIKSMTGPFYFLGHQWDFHVTVFAALLTIAGYQVLHLGLFAKTFAMQQGYLNHDRPMSFLFKNFTLETGLLIGLILFTVGLGINLSIFVEWWQLSFGSLFRIREAILAMTMMVIGIQTIFSSFFLSLLLMKR
jgi:glycosyltransferase involved in cell wall biosynthesis